VTIRVLLFAGAREAAGRSRAEFPAPTSTTVGELADRLVREFGPDLDAVLPSCALWVNGEPAGASTELRDGDEVAVLPPVSGG
jgi:molybdopterin converting factor subunit 1